MHYKTILAVTDLSTTGNAAVRRAALIAANCRAELRLLYAPADDNPAWPYNESHLAELARSTASLVGISVKATTRYATSPSEIAAEANCADLLVSTYRSKTRFETFFKGEWHQQVMRLTRCPVLLTRSSGRLPYGKILVAVDFSKEASHLVQHACMLDDRAELQLFHAISRADEAKLRSADVSWEVVKAFRARQEAYAHARLQQLAHSIDTNGRTLATSMGSGEAARQTSLHQQGSGASLIVVGKHRRSAGMEFVRGAVSSRLLAWSSADVLIVPHDHQASSRAAAKLRIAAERGDGQGGISIRTGDGPMSQGTWDSIAPSLPCSSPAATSTVPSYREYPLRQCVMSAEACFSRVGVVDSMCRRDRYFLKSDGVSARLFAANESALEEARVAASEIYGPLILFGVPEIHSYLGEESEQTVHPVMFLRIRAQRAFAGAIIEELARRFATVIEEYVERELVVVRAEARLSDLLGCSQTLKRLTHASTAVWTWLLRYEAAGSSPLQIQCKDGQQ